MDGWIILDKASGIFSRTADGRVARLFGNKKFGHIGTLDPMASGVLPIAIGNATKMIPFVEEMNPNTKEYLFSMRFGFETDTIDITGAVVRDGGLVPSESEIENILPKFIGEQWQTPPIYSAVHIDGMRAYMAARKNETVDIPPRKITIYELEYTGKSADSYGFRVKCSRGTYVRAIARDIAYKLGTIATVDMIRRTKSGCFDIKNAQKLDFLENLVNNGGDIGKYLMPVDSGLGDIPVLNLDDKDTELYVHGGFIGVARNDGYCRVYNGKTFIGVGHISDGILRPKRTI
jgi:tRNA pseudouridine55 synthase